VGGEAVWETQSGLLQDPLYVCLETTGSLKNGYFKRFLTTETKFVEYWSELYGKEDPEHLRKQKGKVVER
jgi:hypothetical protein